MMKSRSHAKPAKFAKKKMSMPNLKAVIRSR